MCESLKCILFVPLLRGLPLCSAPLSFKGKFMTEKSLKQKSSVGRSSKLREKQTTEHTVQKCFKKQEVASSVNGPIVKKKKKAFSGNTVRQNGVGEGACSACRFYLFPSTQI